MPKLIQIALVDRHQLFREGVKLILEADESFHIVVDGDQFDTFQNASTLIDVDIVLIDINIFMENEEALKSILQNTDTKIIVLANHGEEFFVTKAVKIGVHGFLMKEMDKMSFVQAIRIVKDGDAYIHPNATHNLVEEYRRLIEEEQNEKTEPTFERPYHLYTKRECEILQLLTDGQTNRKIAETLEISEKTVKNHVSSLFKKMQVNDRTQAVVTAIRNNWVQL